VSSGLSPLGFRRSYLSTPRGQAPWKGHQGGGRIQRTTSKIILPATPLDRALYVLVLVLWCTVGMTWLSARARLLNDKITLRLAQSNGRRSVLKEIDWWRAGRAKRARSRGIQMGRTGRARPRRPGAPPQRQGLPSYRAAGTHCCGGRRGGRRCCQREEAQEGIGGDGRAPAPPLLSPSPLAVESQGLDFQGCLPFPDSSQAGYTQAYLGVPCTQTCSQAQALPLPESWLRLRS